ncbi:MAG: ribonuclease [Pseudonocardiales bacterium]|nr:ribonuclease [Pseudonocardiales bacterium]
MLPRAHRMTSSDQFAETISRGRRAGAPSIVIYATSREGTTDEPTATTAVGFVVSKAVGNSVVRHRVLRQLRALVAARLPVVDGYHALVVRALPAAAGRPSAMLGADLDRALIKAARPPRAMPSAERAR